MPLVKYVHRKLGSELQIMKSRVIECFQAGNHSRCFQLLHIQDGPPLLRVQSRHGITVIKSKICQLKPSFTRFFFLFFFHMYRIRRLQSVHHICQNNTDEIKRFFWIYWLIPMTPGGSGGGSNLALLLSSACLPPTRIWYQSPCFFSQNSLNTDGNGGVDIRDPKPSIESSMKSSINAILNSWVSANSSTSPSTPQQTKAVLCFS
ncbi:unnamed protein product [Absidia cylindrospora]